MAAESVTSVLLIDFDGVRRSLNAIDVEAGDQLAASAGRWLEALENGDLISPSGPRRILLRRCFADPDMLGDGSKAMADSGFDVIDSPARKGGTVAPNSTLRSTPSTRSTTPSTTPSSFCCRPMPTSRPCSHA